MVEGLPSSGKTTSAKIVNEILKGRSINNEIFYEGDINHPADYDGVAFFDDIKFHRLIELFPSYKEDIHKITTKRGANYYVWYKKGISEYKINFSEELCHQFYQNDIYELPLDVHMKIIKDKWIEFSQEAFKQEKVYIFDCPFIQNPITVAMIRDNAEKDVIIRYIKDLEAMIKDLNPILLYVDQQDIEYSFSKAIDERPKEWLEFFVNYYTKQGYGKAHNYEGLDGVIKVLTAREKIEKHIMQSLNINTHIIDNSEFNLEKHKESIKDILQNMMD